VFVVCCGVSQTHTLLHLVSKLAIINRFSGSNRDKMKCAEERWPCTALWTIH